MGAGSSELPASLLWFLMNLAALSGGVGTLIHNEKNLLVCKKLKERQLFLTEDSKVLSCFY